MTARRSSEDGDRAALEEAMRGVKPLGDRGSRVIPGSSKPPTPRPGPPEEKAEFEIVESGERLAGVARGIDRSQLRRLRSGAFPVEVRVDLHGLAADAARQRVREVLRQASEAGSRCALVIHGRGLHSQDAPILKAALVDWLREPPLGRLVMAYTSASLRQGGAGATLILLRRNRRAKSP